MGKFQNLSFGLFYFATTLALTIARAAPLAAKNPQSIPAEIKEAISKIETAANRQDLEAVMSYYSKDFSHSDGLDRTSFSQALEKIWRRYPRIKYTTTIKSWDRVNDRLIVETETAIAGRSNSQQRLFRLNAKIRSRQHFLDRKIVKQEILAERSQINAGDNPPKLTINLPEKVRPGQRFLFDAIVRKPLEAELLLGNAIEQKASSAIYFQPSDLLELQVLPAGGIFKIVQAPLIADNILYSIIIARGDGITTFTQRVIVAE